MMQAMLDRGRNAVSGALSDSLSSTFVQKLVFQIMGDPKLWVDEGQELRLTQIVLVNISRGLHMLEPPLFYSGVLQNARNWLRRVKNTNKPLSVALDAEGWLKRIIIHMTKNTSDIAVVRRMSASVFLFSLMSHAKATEVWTVPVKNQAARKLTEALRRERRVLRKESEDGGDEDRRNEDKSEDKEVDDGAWDAVFFICYLICKAVKDAMGRGWNTEPYGEINAGQLDVLLMTWVPDIIEVYGCKRLEQVHMTVKRLAVLHAAQSLDTNIDRELLVFLNAEMKVLPDAEISRIAFSQAGQLMNVRPKSPPFPSGMPGADKQPDHMLLLAFYAHINSVRNANPSKNVADDFGLNDMKVMIDQVFRIGVTLDISGPVQREVVQLISHILETMQAQLKHQTTAFFHGLTYEKVGLAITPPALSVILHEVVIVSAMARLWDRSALAEKDRRHIQTACVWAFRAAYPLTLLFLYKNERKFLSALYPQASAGNNADTAQTADVATLDAAAPTQNAAAATTLPPDTGESVVVVP